MENAYLAKVGAEINSSGQYVTDMQIKISDLQGRKSWLTSIDLPFLPICNAWFLCPTFMLSVE